MGRRRSFARDRVTAHAHEEVHGADDQNSGSSSPEVSVCLQLYDRFFHLDRLFHVEMRISFVLDGVIFLWCFCRCPERHSDPSQVSCESFYDLIFASTLS